MENFERVRTRKISFDLPILIIYNPVSGKAVNLIPVIETRLNKDKIPFEVMPTKKRYDTFNYAKDADFAKYSMIVAAGGDGSFHEVVNGMLSRPDGKKLPVGLIPNGSGNDTTNSLGVMNLHDALEYIACGEVIKADTVSILLDHDKIEDVSPATILDHHRHMIINSALAVTANIVREAEKYKWCCGTNCYAVATLQEAVLGRLQQYKFDLEIDGKKADSLSSIMVMIFNGKSTGGGMIVDPFAAMNDGLVDIMSVSDPTAGTLMGVADMLDKAKK